MSGFMEAMDFKEDLSYVERGIAEIASRFTPHPLNAAFQQLIGAGGKRIRPTLLVLSFRSLDGESSISYAAPIAIAVELIHSATLVHDDIIDRSTKRRGVETVFKKWGEEAAILVGDLLFSEAFGLVGVHEIPELTEVISETCIKLTEGEMLEFRHTGNTSMTEEVYLEIIERKTASLFEASTRCGGLLAHAREGEVEALARYGFNFGVCFQIIDDILDITGGEKFGKPQGIDIREGKVTIPVIHALKHSRHSGELEEIIGKSRKKAGDIKRAEEILRDAGSIEYALERAEWFSRKAESELKGIPEGRAKKALHMLASSVLRRPF